MKCHFSNDIIRKEHFSELLGTIDEFFVSMYPHLSPCHLKVPAPSLATKRKAPPPITAFLYFHFAVSP